MELLKVADSSSNGRNIKRLLCTGFRKRRDVCPVGGGALAPEPCSELLVGSVTYPERTPEVWVVTTDGTASRERHPGYISLYCIEYVLTLLDEKYGVRVVPM